MALFRRRTLSGAVQSGNIDNTHHPNGKENGNNAVISGKSQVKKEIKQWGCMDSCCWTIGFICTAWWFLLVLYNTLPPSLPQYITGPYVDPPGIKLKKEGLKAYHPIILVPGIVTGGLELWEGRPCAEGLFRKRLWGGTFGEVYKSIFSDANGSLPLLQLPRTRAICGPVQKLLSLERVGPFCLCLQQPEFLNIAENLLLQKDTIRIILLSSNPRPVAPQCSSYTSQMPAVHA
eukprot:Gb_39375 [translate_table: standard]